MAHPNRLEELMQAKRLELGMKTWRSLATEAGISYETLRALRAGENYAPATAYAVETALQWAPGSIAQILEGGEPTPATQGHSGNQDPGPRRSNVIEVEAWSAPIPDPNDPVEVELWNMEALPEADREEYIALWRAKKSRRRRAR